MDADSYRTVQIGVSKFWANKYACEASKNWDKFYKRNQKNFYRDRHWTNAASTDGFPGLMDPPSGTKSQVVLVEAGCGVANCAFPLLASNPALFIYAFDFAASAVQLVREADEYRDGRCCAFEWDFCTASIADVLLTERKGLEPSTADFCTLIFVLSAVPPDRQLSGLKNLFSLLRPGGRILFRDYAIGDMAQSRFASRSRIEDNYFVRQDSTLSYFFDEERVHHLMTSAGFEKGYMRRINRVIKNRKENLEMHRVFLQAEYIRPEERNTG